MCIEDVMTPKCKCHTFIAYISSIFTPFQKHFTSLYRATPVLHFMFWLLRCTLWLERIISPNLKFSSKIIIIFLIINEIKRVIPCKKECDKSFVLYYYTYDIPKAILHQDPDFCQHFLFSITLPTLNVETSVILLWKALSKDFISFVYT